jgi:hypothetical protein
LQLEKHTLQAPEHSGDAEGRGEKKKGIPEEMPWHPFIMFSF